MNVFMPSGAYRPELDIRWSDRLPSWTQNLVQGNEPNAECWLVVMPRRAGKTWLAAGIVRARRQDLATDTAKVDLRNSPSTIKRAGLQCLVDRKAKPNAKAQVVIVDEPALAPSGRPGGDAGVLRDGLAKLREEGIVPVVLATPAEHELLMPHLSHDAVKDVLLPPALTEDEVARLTGRAEDWAPELAQRILTADQAWGQTPFLLELALRVAEDDLLVRSDVTTLLDRASDQALQDHLYLDQFFQNGLSSRQRAQVRALRWEAAGLPATTGAQVLHRTPIAADPILARHLPEVLRIHHISDPHHGGHLRQLVDAKDKTIAGKRLAALAGAGSPLDSYLEHVRQLRRQGRAPHLILLTGDVVNRPGHPSGQAALVWLDQLRPLLSEHPDLRPEDPRILLVGGNHDVSWEYCLDPRPQRRHEWFATTFADYPHPDLQLADAEQRRLMVHYPGAGLRVALLGSAESGGEAAHDRDQAMLESIRAHYEADPDASEEKLRDLVRDLEHLDPGIVMRKVLDRLAFEPGYLTFAALHHPVSAIPTVEVTPYSGVLNAGQAKRALVSARTSLVLHGHTHTGFLAAERFLGQPDPWTMRISGAATLASAASDEQNAYNEVFVSREGDAHSLVIRQVRLDGGQWLPQPHVSFHPGAAAECSLAELMSGPPAHV